MKIPLGEILIESGIITVKTLERALIRQQGSDKRLGMFSDEMGVITREELVEALAKQSGFEHKGHGRAGVPDQLLELIPREIAQRSWSSRSICGRERLAVAPERPLDRNPPTSWKTVLHQGRAGAGDPRGHPGGGQASIICAEAAERNGTLKILVVDDSAEVTSDVGEALKKEGYEVLTANDGVEGLRIAFSDKIPT